MKKLTVLLALTLLAACNPKKSAVQANSGTAVIAGVSTGTQCVATTATGDSTIGAVYDTTANSYNFENQVKALLSAAISPYGVGSISPIPNSADGTGVRFNGTIKLDANGNVVGSQSKLFISVYDSIYVNDHSQGFIKVNFDPSVAVADESKRPIISGSFNTQTGMGTLTVKDDYGSIVFNGTIDAQYFSGSITFQNTKTVIGTLASGSLGQFKILRCGILQ
jgi:hypothetical protein